MALSVERATQPISPHQEFGKTVDVFMNSIIRGLESHPRVKTAGYFANPPDPSRNGKPLSFKLGPRYYLVRYQTTEGNGADSSTTQWLTVQQFAVKKIPNGKEFTHNATVELKTRSFFETGTRRTFVDSDVVSSIRTKLTKREQREKSELQVERGLAAMQLAQREFGELFNHLFD